MLGVEVGAISELAGCVSVGMYCCASLCKMQNAKCKMQNAKCKIGIGMFPPFHRHATVPLDSDA